MVKKIQKHEELYIQFTPEELAELGWEEGDKFSCKTEGGKIILTKFAKLDLDMTEWPVEVLHSIIKESAEKDISVNEVISNILEQYIGEHNGTLT